MGEVVSVLRTWPEWAGSIPLWGVFVLLAIIAVRTSPQWLETWSRLKLAKEQRVASRITELEGRLADCEIRCTEEKRELRDEIEGLRRQRNAEQLVIMRAIVDMSNDPAVKQQLALLEAVEISLGKANRRSRENEVQHEG